MCRFEALKRNLRPYKFFGLCRNYVQPHSPDPHEPREPHEPHEPLEPREPMQLQ